MMDGHHPKRRKDKDNPYTIYTSADGQHWLSFADGQGVAHELEIDETLFRELDAFERLDLAHLNEVDRHYEQSAQTEVSLQKRAAAVPEGVEEIVLRRIQSETLHKVISALPEKQQRRLLLYFFAEMTYKQIALLEKCSYPAVVKSVKAALDALKKYFQK